MDQPTFVDFVLNFYEQYRLPPRYYVTAGINFPWSVYDCKSDMRVMECLRSSDASRVCGILNKEAAHAR